MRFTSAALAVAATVSGANAASKGFNYGAFFGNNQAKVYDDFKYEFEAAQQLPGTNGQFNSARLYTMIQFGTTNTIISAIQAAIDTKTELLLGIWASAGQDVVTNEITALKAAAAQYGTAFSDLVVGISVGSEDLYRITPTAIGNGETNPGAQPSELVNYVNQVRSAIAGTSLANAPIGHVDTWTAYDNSSNAAVVEALDWIGVDAYPFWEVAHGNSIGVANATFYDALQTTKNASKGKPVWVTETGWPVSGPTQGEAVASAENAGIYWEDVTCSLLSQGVNLWYYTLQDVQYSTPSPSFGLKPGGDIKNVDPLYSLSCPDLTPPFVAPYLIVPIDSSDPSKIIGNAYTGQLSPTRSTLFALDIPPTPGKTCNLVFMLPTPFDPQYPSPYTLSSPGGIVVSRLSGPNTATTSAATTPESTIVGDVPRVIPGNKFLLENAPCAAGQQVGYRVDSIGGLDLNFFQVSGPAAVGLFMEVSD
ncbi:glycoside hydrolase [Massarina eburnea CBS 473.64]|uniref:glucan endo-1,3-beta-D-glucosidase n=1 Tax=Massarina eburnea CBS 473.64 TaxID=1395130 RepID=A0A6A6S0U1_9PLEO|nr:glycoside hydrolase [Massarina eburnea CBS 473.64]